MERVGRCQKSQEQTRGRVKHDTVQISLWSLELVMAACLEQAAAGHSPDRQTRRLRSGTVLETLGEQAQ